MITSRANALVRRARRLRDARARREEGAFVAEGLRVVLSALESSAPVETLLVCPARLTSEVAWAAVEAATARGVPRVDLSPAAFAALSGRENPTGLAAIVGTARVALAGLRVPADGIFVALEGISDPGNLGAVLRTLDAAGAGGLVLVAPETDPYHPAAVRASLGAVFRVPIADGVALPALWEWAAGAGMEVVGSSARAAESFWTAPFARPLVLLVGSEREGLSAAARAGASRIVGIPMSGGATSLNLAVAVGLLVYEARRREIG